MKYTTRYNKSAKQNMRKAQLDCRNYLGKRLGYVVNCMKDELIQQHEHGIRNYLVFKFSLSMAGIEGMYPVNALIRMAHRKAKKSINEYHEIYEGLKEAAAELNNN